MSFIEIKSAIERLQRISTSTATQTSTTARPFLAFAATA
jgi:hypothetical protein